MSINIFYYFLFLCLFYSFFCTLSDNIAFCGGDACDSSHLYLNPGYSKNCINESQSLYSFTQHYPFKMQYQERGDWLWFSYKYTIYSSTHGVYMDNHSVYKVRESHAAYIYSTEIRWDSWCYVEHLNQLFVIDKYFVGLDLVPRISLYDIDSSTYISLDDTSAFQMAYDSVTRNVVLVDRDYVYILNPDTRSIESIYYFCDLYSCSGSWNRIVITSYIFVNNNRLWISANVDVNSHFRNQILVLYLDNIGTFSRVYTTNQEDAYLLTVSEDNNLFVWSSESSPNTFVSTFTEDENGIYEIFTGIFSTKMVYSVFAFKSAKYTTESIKELGACSLSGQLINGTCHCDNYHYGERCGTYCDISICENGYCDNNGNCVCNVGYHMENNECILNSIVPEFPDEFYTMYNETNLTSQITTSYQWYYSRYYFAERIDNLDNEKIFFIQDNLADIQVEANGISCSMIVRAFLPSQMMPSSSLLVVDNYTYNGEICKKWETPDGFITTITTEIEGYTFPIYIKDLIKGIEQIFSINQTIITNFESDYSWVTSYGYCEACVDDPNNCVTSTATISFSNTPSITQSRYSSVSITPSISVSSGKTITKTPSPTYQTQSHSPTPSNSKSRSPSHTKTPRTPSPIFSPSPSKTKTTSKSISTSILNFSYLFSTSDSDYIYTSDSDYIYTSFSSINSSPSTDSLSSSDNINFLISIIVGIISGFIIISCCCCIIVCLIIIITRTIIKNKKSYKPVDIEMDKLAVVE